MEPAGSQLVDSLEIVLVVGQRHRQIIVDVECQLARVYWNGRSSSTPRQTGW